ncbi:MAG: MlaD family protein [Spirosomataceae bacterium]
MSKEVKVAILAIVSIVIFYFGFRFLKGSELFSTENDYFVVYDNVDGLAVSNQVMLNGFTIGRVKAITILPETQHRLLVNLSIRNDIPLTDSTVAVLADGGLLGGKMIYFKIGKGKAIGDQDTLLASKEIGLSALLKERALPVLKNADSLIISLSKVVHGFRSTGTVLTKMLETTDQTIGQTGKVLTGTIEENRLALKALSANLNTLSTNLIQTEKQLPLILGKVNTMADSLGALRLGETLNQAKVAVTSLQRMMTGIEKGNGSLGKLLKDEGLYKNINQVSSNLDKLLVNFRTYPKRYVHFSLFGKKDKGSPNNPPDSVKTVPSDSVKK